MATDSFFNLNKGHGDSITNYLINCLLHARIDTHTESNEDYYDEDVNVYLANLLHEYMKPSFLDHAAQYLCKYDTEISERVSQHHDKIYTYFIYKTNADYYLLSLTLFGGLQPKHVPMMLRISRKNFTDRAKAYYSYAADYDRKIHRKITAVSEILHKISEHFPKYVTILKQVRSNYFNLLKEMGTGEFFHLTREANEEADKKLYTEKVDQLLDTYNKYRTEPSEDDKQKLILLSDELRTYNPSFGFKIE